MTTAFEQGKHYECLIVRKLDEEFPDRPVYRWENTPELVLYEVGLIGDWNEHRLRRLRARQDADEGHGLRDTGIDLVAQGPDGRWTLIQAKAYSHTVTQDCLAGFFKHMSLVQLRRGRTVRGVVVHSSQLSAPVRHYIEDMDGLVEERILPMEVNPPPPPLEPDLELYPEQRTAVDALLAWIGAPTASPRGVLSMPCGTGKTVVTAHFLRAAADRGHLVVAVVTIPLREHARQMRRRIAPFLPPHWTSKLVDSDGCRDAAALTAQIQQTPTLLVCTYESMDVVRELLPVLSGRKWVLVIDEFHNLSRADVGLCPDEHRSDIHAVLMAAPHTLAVSATPRVFELEGQDDDDADSMGPVLYRLGWQHAIERGLIADYRLFVPSLSEPQDFLDDQARELGLDAVARPLEARCNFVLKGMLDEGYRRCIVYVPSGPGMRASETAAEYGAMLSRLGQAYFGVDVAWSSVLCEDTARQRKERMCSFCDDPVQTDDGRPHLRFLLSVRILDEAIDLPPCDCVFFPSPTGSKIRSVQRLSRALRRHTPGKVAGGFLWCDKAYDEHAELLSALREIDPRCRRTAMCSGVLRRKLPVKRAFICKPSARFLGQVRRYRTISLGPRTGWKTLGIGLVLRTSYSPRLTVFRPCTWPPSLQ